MRVLMISQSIYGDGIGTVTYNLHCALAKRGIFVDIACFQKFDINDVHSQVIIEHGCKLVHIDGLKKSGIIGVFRQVKELCKNNHYDAIHIHTGLFAWIYALPAAMYGVRKRVAHAHGQMSNMPKGMERILKWPFRILNRLICTDLVGCTKPSNLFAYSVEGCVIPNFVPTDYILSVSDTRIQELRKHYSNGEKDKLIFSFMGNVDVNKNVVFLPEVIDELRKRGLNPRLLIMGTGIKADAVKEKICSLHLENDILMLGRCDNCNEIVQASDYYITASFSEGMSMSILEAQMAGKTCFVSENISTDSDLGIGLFEIVESYDPKNWAATIFNFVKNESVKMSREEAIDKTELNGKGETSAIDKLIKIYGE